MAALTAFGTPLPGPTHMRMEVSYANLFRVAANDEELMAALAAVGTPLSGLGPCRHT